MKKCKICPRACKINRNEKAGFCGVQKLKVAKVMRHMWEEPFISGTNGSGMIFFSGCNMKCVFCQNFEISQNLKGNGISVGELIEIFKKLEKAGVHNINLVSPTQFSDEIIEALKRYKPSIPVVWNSNGYEKKQTIKKLKGLVDIFLVDLKYSNNALAEKYSFSPNYFKVAKSAILQMRKNIKYDCIDSYGIMTSGLVVRHLILPGEIANSLNVIDWINHKLGNKTYLSIMSQFTPCHKAKSFENLKRKIKPIEQKAILNFAEKKNFENLFFQGMESASDAFIPNFDIFWEV